jgi:hypothetical protein
MLQERAADAVDDALRRPSCRTRHHVERRVERHPFEFERGAGRPKRAETAFGRLASRFVGQYGMTTTRRRTATVRAPPNRSERIQRLSAVEIAVRRKQHARCNLAETVEHAVDAGRASTRPHRAEARRGEHGDDRLGRFGTIRDAVPGPMPIARNPAAIRATSARSSR